MHLHRKKAVYFTITQTNKGGKFLKSYNRKQNLSPECAKMDDDFDKIRRVLDNLGIRTAGLNFNPSKKQIQVSKPNGPGAIKKGINARNGDMVTVTMTLLRIGQKIQNNDENFTTNVEKRLREIFGKQKED